MSLRIKTHALPVGYTELEYIEAVGTGVSSENLYYIDTGVTTTLNTEIETDIKHISTNQYIFTPFALNKTGSGTGWAVSEYSAGPAWAVKGGAGSWTNMGNIPLNTNCHLLLNKDGFTVNGTFQERAISSYDATENMFIMCSIWGSSIAAVTTMQMKEFIMRENGVETFHGIPAKNSSNVAGMYDAVSKTFKVNGGTGTLIAGPEVTTPTKALKEIHELRKSDGQGGVQYIGEIYQKNPEWAVPDGYTQLEYLESTGEQYIDTGFAPLPSDEFEGKICVTEDNSNGCFFGASTKFSWAAGNSSIALPQTTDKKAYFRYGNNPTTAICLTTADTPINISLKETTLTIGDNTETIIRESSWSSTVPTLYLFNRHAEIIGSSTFVKGRIYYLKWFSNNILVRNMIPAKNSSNVLGMYDTVNNVFYTNQGSGDFTAGPEIPKLLPIFSAGYDRTVSGSTLPLTLPDARAKATTWQIDGQSRQGVLPDGYTQLEYIQSNSDAYIDTGFKPNQDTKWEYKFKCDNLTDSVMAGARTGYGTKMYILGCTQGGSVFGAGYGNTTEYPGVVSADTNIHTFIIDKNKWYFDGELRATMGTYTFQGDYNMYLFRGNNSGSLTNTCSQRVYYSKIYDNGTLVRNFIPAKNSSNVLGMYDTVTNTFFTNAGSGTFTAGPVAPSPSCPVDVNGCGNSGLPNGYKKLEYIESSGTQWIDTGIKPNGATGMSITYINKTNSDTVQMGMRENISNTRFWINQTSGVVCVCAIDISGTNSVTTIYGNKTQIKFNYLNNGKAIKNDITSGTTQEIILTGTIPSYTNSIGIFSGPTAGSPQWSASIQCFGAEITEGSEIVFNGIPAQRKSDSVIGMYDTVSNTFFTNAATSGDDFIAGPEDTSCVVPVMVNREVPLEYKQLEYIQSSGEQYIDTGYLPTTADEINCDFVCAELNNCAVFGSLGIDTPVPRWRVVQFNGGTGSNYYIHTAITVTTTIPCVLNQNYNIKLNKDAIIVNGTTFKSSIGNAIYSTYLFADNNDGTAVSKGAVKIKSYSVKHSGTLVINLIPAQRISDSVIGMYDTVSKTFFTNAGTGTFIAGPEVGALYNISLPSPLQKIGTYKDTIESDGTLTRGVGIKVLDGTESWTYDQTWGRFYTILADLPSTAKTARTVPGFSTHYEWISDSRGVASVTAGQGYFADTGGGKPGVYLHDSHTSVADFTAWLASNNVIIYYPLETPTETTVEVPQLSTAKGTNYISAETQIKPSNMSVTYRKKTK